MGAEMILYTAYTFLIASVPLLLYRMLKGPHWSDRVLAADMLGIYLIAGLLILQEESQWEWDRDVIWMMLGLSLVTVLGAGLLMEDIERDR